MDERFRDYTVYESDRVIEALKKIDANRQGFVIVVDLEKTVLGVLTDGDLRRAFIRGYNKEAYVSGVYTKEAKTVFLSDGFETVSRLFKNQAIKFLPVVDDNNCLVNIITKNQMHTLLLQDIHADLGYDFFSLDTGVIDYEIFQRPWGFYKTTVLNDYYQAKVICVKPKSQLSLQSHEHREEHWIVVHGTGIIHLEKSVLHVSCGSSVFIPKGAKHRVLNTDEQESLIITEVQIVDYLGEDDIIRYEDIYGRI